MGWGVCEGVGGWPRLELGLAECISMLVLEERDIGVPWVKGWI